MSLSFFFRSRYFLALGLALFTFLFVSLIDFSLLFRGVLPYMAVQGAEVVEGRAFPMSDPDGAKWLMVLEEGVKTGSWRVGDSPVDALWNGQKTQVFWSSGYYWWLRSIQGVLGVFLPVEASCSWAAILSGPLLFLFYVVVVSLLALRVIPGIWGAFLVPLLMLFWSDAVFSAFRPDHHGMIFFATTLWLLFFFYPTSRGLYFSGFFLGVALWLSTLTTIPLLGVFCLSLLVGEICGVSVVSWKRWPVWGGIAAGVAMVLWFVDYFPSRMGMRLEIVHPLWAAAVLGGTFLLSRLILLFRGEFQPLVLGRFSPGLVGLLAAVGVVAPVFSLVYSGGSWFYPSYPWVKDLMTVISELQPMVHLSYLFSFFLLPLSLVVMLCWEFGRSRIFPVLLLGVILLLFPIVQTRWLSYTVLFACFAYLLWMGGNSFAGRAWFPRLALGVFLGSFFLPAAFVMFSRADSGLNVVDKVSSSSGAFSRTLSAAELAWKLRVDNGGKPFVLLGPPDVGTWVSYYGRGSSVGSMYWEAWKGLRDWSEFFGAENDKNAILVLRDYGVDYVVFQKDKVSFSKGGKNPRSVEDSLYSRIEAGKVPAWLEKMDWKAPDGAQQTLFKVLWDKIPGGKAGG